MASTAYANSAAPLHQPVRRKQPGLNPIYARRHLLFLKLKLWLMCLGFGFYESFVLLFLPRYRAFQVLSTINRKGVWSCSYVLHKEFQTVVRAFTIAAIAFIILTIVILLVLLNNQLSLSIQP